MHTAACWGTYLGLALPPLPLPCSVRWHMASVGSETDMHSLHLHGNTWLK